MSFNGESRRSSWTKLRWHFCSIHEHELRGTPEFVRYHSEVDVESSSRDSECDNDWLDIAFMDEIYTFSRSSDHVDESSVRVCSDSALSLVKMSDHSEAHRRWEYQVKKSTVQLLQRIMWNWWRTDRVRVEYFPGTYVIGDLQKTQEGLQDRNIEPEVWRLNHLHVNVQWHRMDKERKFRNMCVEFRTSQELREEVLARTLDILRPGDDKKWYGTLSYTREGKWDSTNTQMVERFKEIGHPAIKSVSALSRGILTRKNDINTIHFNADATNTELLCRTIHEANQFSIYGAVSSWCEEFGLRPNDGELTSERFVTKENEQLLKGVKPQEVNSFVHTPKSDDPVSGNRLREQLHNFETQKKEIQFTQVCEDASFFGRVSVGMCYKAIADVDDGFGDRSPACTRITHRRVDSDSRLCRISRTNNNWTRSSSSTCTISWHSWNWYSDTIHDNEGTTFFGSDLKLLGGDMPRKETLRGWVTLQRSRTQSPRVMNYFWKGPLQKKVNFVLQSWSNPAPRKRMRRNPKYRRVHKTIRKKLF